MPIAEIPAEDPTRCPSSAELLAFDSGWLAEGAIDRVLSHLETGCIQCTSTLEADKTRDEFAEVLRAAGRSDDSPRSEFLQQPLPGFELIELLGEGGMGVVYKARQTKLNRMVALKMMRGGYRIGPKELIRFLAEAEAVAAVRHRHVVQVYEFGDAAGRPFLAMEFLEGGGLAERLQDLGRLDPKVAAALLRKLAEAIQAAHALGIVHRDLKPANVLFDEFGEPKITDFGLAKRGVGSDLTATQAVMGTPAYMAPEQARGETKFVGPAADLYSLGVIFYQCLTGTLPFDDPNPIALLRKVAEEEPERPRKHVPKLPRDVEWICLKCLAKAPHERYLTAQLLAEDLGRFIAGEPVSVRAAGQFQRVYKWARRKPTLAAAYGITLFAAMLLAIGVSLAVLWSRAENARDTASEKMREAERLKVQYERSDYARTMQVSQHEWEVGNVEMALSLLHTTNSDLRNWEWSFLHRRCSAEATLVGRTRSGIAAVAITPDGVLARTIGGDGQLREWDLKNRCEVGVPLRIEVSATHLSVFDSRAGHAALWSASNRLFVWDVAARTHTPMNATSDPVCPCAISPGGVLLATGTSDGVVKICDVRTGAFVCEWKVENESDVGPAGRTIRRICSLEFSRTGERLAVGSRDRVSIWDIASRERIWFGPGYLNSPREELHAVEGLNFVGREERRIVSAGYFDPRVPERAELMIHSPNRPGEPPRVLANRSRRFTPVTVSSDGARLAYTDDNRLAIVLDLESGRELNRIRAPEGLQMMTFTPDGTRLLTVGVGGVLRIWDLESGSDCEIVRLNRQARVFGMTPVDGGRIAIFTALGGPDPDEYRLCVWERASKRPIGFLALDNRGNAPSDVAVSSDGNLIAVGLGAGVVQVWDWRNRKRVAVLAGSPGDEGVARIAFTPDGKIVAGLRNGAVKIWNPGSPQKSREIYRCRGTLAGLALSPDGQTIAVGGGAEGGDTVQVVRVETGQVFRSIPTESASTNSLAFSPDGERIALSTMAPSSVQIWNWKSAKRIATTQAAHRGMIQFTLFTPDGRRVITGSNDESIKIWDAELGLELLSLHDHTSALNRGAILPNGLLFTSSWDGTIRVWDGRTNTE